MKVSGKKKKSKKKLVIGVGILAVAAVAGANIYGSRNAAENAVPQIEVVKAVRDNVQQTVETSGTVVSEEQKTYFSPVNAKVDVADVKEGETVKAGTKLIEFETENLEKDNQRAELNLKSTRSDIKDTVNKSEKADKKQKDAKGYELYRKTGKKGSYKKIKVIKKGSTVTYTNSKLKKGKTYYYKIRSYKYDTNGKKIYSSWSSVKGKTSK